MIIEHTSPYYNITYKLSVSLSEYSNGQNAILLYDTADGFPYATASVSLPNYEMDSDEVAIKNYSENEGILESLITAGIISKPHLIITSGHVNIPICKIIKTA
jgi:hypothetical protein